MKGRSLGRLVTVAAVLSMTALLSACTTLQQPVSVSDVQKPVLVNPDYQAGQVDTSDSVPSLEAIINQTPTGNPVASKDGDKLRSPALKDAALSFGAQAGLAWESRAINQMLNGKSDELSKVYDFQRVMIKGPDNVMILPPVISQANETWESSEAGKTLRVADTYYEIIAQAQFAPTAPLWQGYLLRTYKSPAPTPDMLLPRDAAEHDAWKNAVVEGWNMGRQQAQDIFKDDLARLERDFTGMVRYKALLEQGKVSPPVVADAKLGTTGNGLDMRENDRAVRITQDPSLQVGGTGAWQAPATTAYPDGQTTGNDPSQPKPACPTGFVPAAKQVSAQLVCVPATAPQASRKPSKSTAATSPKQRAAWQSF